MSTPNTENSKPPHRPLLVVLTLAILVALVWHNPTLIGLPARSVAPIDDLQYAADGFRPVRGRLAGNFGYAPFSPRIRDTDVASAGQDFDHAVRDNTPRGEPEQSPAISGYHAVIDYLSHRDARRAADTLFEVCLTVTASDPAAADLWNNLAVIYLERADGPGDYFDAIEALNAAEKAIQADGDRHEAYFNRALALEMLYLHDEALTAWDGVIARESDSPWAREAEEAKARIKALAPGSAWREFKGNIEAAIAMDDQATLQSLAETNPGLTRYWLISNGLGAWVEARITPDRAGGAQFEAAFTLLAKALDDAFLRDLSQWHGDAAELDPILAEWKRGFTLLGSRLYGKSVQAFQTALAGLQKVDHPLKSLATYQVALGLYLDLDFPGSVNTLQGIESLSTLGGIYASIYADGLRLSGLISGNTGDLEIYQQQFQNSLDIAVQLNDRNRIFSASRELATVWTLRGDYRRAIVDRARVFDHFQEIASSIGPYLVYSGFATDLDRLGFQTIPAYFFRAVRKFAEETGNPSSIAQALRIYMASLRSRGEHEKAQTLLTEAEELASQVEDQGARQRLGSDILATKGTLAAKEQPQQAIDWLNQAIDLYRDEGNGRGIPDLLLSRAEAQRILGRTIASEESYREAIALIERFRSNIKLDQTFAIEFFDVYQSAFEGLVDLLLDEGQDEDAFFTAERSRGRLLLDRLAVTQGQDIKAEHTGEGTQNPTPTFATEIPDDVVLVSYVVAGDRVGAWILEGSSRRYVQLETPRSVLEAPSAEHPDRAPYQYPTDFTPAILGELFSQILTPLNLPPDKTLVVAPDRFLWRIPFQALLDPATGRHLIEDRMVAITPSVAVYCQSSRNPQEALDLQSAQLLVVGNPAFNRAEFPGLNSLAGAKEEAKYLADLVPGSRLLTDQNATPSALLKSLEEATLFHFGGHALADDKNPMQSKLVLAPEWGFDETGVLTAGQIYPSNLSNLRLVVLSACNTGRPGLSPSEGGGNLARPFLAAGATSVIATLWPTLDQNSQRFMLKFYDQLERTGSPSRAYQATLRHWIQAERHGEPTTNWQAHTLFGTP